MSLVNPPPPDAAKHMADLRVSYDSGRLDEASVLGTPFEQFRRWMTEAVAASVPEPNAMVLATVGADEQPTTRTVLLKDVDPRGFVFFTNYGSTKSREMAEHPGVSMTFPWIALHRQIVVVGRAEKVPRQESEEYFTTRPFDSRLGAWTSRQSEVIADRSVIVSQFARLSEEYPVGSEIPVPDFWGGWVVRAISVEFWQGRESRLHDRLRFRSASGQPADLDVASNWVLERLSP